MSNTSWIVLCLAAVLAPGCVSSAKYLALQDELARTQDELAYSRDSLTKAEELLTTAELDRDELERLRQALVTEQQDKANLAAQLEEFQKSNAMLAGVGWEGVVNAAEGTYGYRAHGDVLFASGSSDLTTGGRSALDALVDTLKKDPNPIRIDGHTDADPVRKTKEQYPDGNIELGAKRAIAVRKYLIERGISEDRISIASFGEFKPVLPGRDADSKSRNRRVEVLLQYPRTASNRG